MATRTVTIEIKSEADLKALKDAGLAIREVNDAAGDAADPFAELEDLADRAAAAQERAQQALDGSADAMGSVKDAANDATGGLLDLALAFAAGDGISAVVQFATSKIAEMIIKLAEGSTAFHDFGAEAEGNLQRVKRELQDLVKNLAIARAETDQSAEGQLRLLKVQEDRVSAELAANNAKIQRDRARGDIEEDESLRLSNLAEIAAAEQQQAIRRKRDDIEFVRQRKNAEDAANTAAAAEKKRDDEQAKAAEAVLREQEERENLDRLPSRRNLEALGVVGAGGVAQEALKQREILEARLEAAAEVQEKQIQAVEAANAELETLQSKASELTNALEILKQVQVESEAIHRSRLETLKQERDTALKVKSGSLDDAETKAAKARDAQTSKDNAKIAADEQKALDRAIAAQAKADAQALKLAEGGLRAAGGSGALSEDAQRVFRRAETALAAPGNDAADLRRAVSLLEQLTGGLSARDLDTSKAISSLNNALVNALKGIEKAKADSAAALNTIKNAGIR